MASVKASFNLPEEELNQLRELASQRNVSVTQALRQAIADSKFIQEQSEQKNKVLVDDGKGAVKEVIFNR